MLLSKPGIRESISIITQVPATSNRRTVFFGDHRFHKMIMDRQKMILKKEDLSTQARRLYQSDGYSNRASYQALNQTGSMVLAPVHEEKR